MWSSKKPPTAPATRCGRLRILPTTTSSILGLLWQMQYICCLRDLSLSIPPAASMGDTVTISCHYHLQGEQLYTAKLYKGRDEFLQLVPEKKKPLKEFPLKGINIKEVLLNGTGRTVTGLQVTLRDVNLFTTGLYGCEASADPSFHTELVRKHLEVLVKPESRPQISGVKPRFSVGEVTNLTCQLHNTFPSANISWFVSGDRLSPHSSPWVQQTILKSPTTSLLTTKSVLTLPLLAKHFVDGSLSLKCVASLLTMHWQSTDVHIKEESPKLASVLDNNNGTNGKDGSADGAAPKTTGEDASTKRVAIAKDADSKSATTKGVKRKETRARGGVLIASGAQNGPSCFLILVELGLFIFFHVRQARVELLLSNSASASLSRAS